jgi:hypothetical protein
MNLGDPHELSTSGVAVLQLTLLDDVANLALTLV